MRRRDFVRHGAVVGGAAMFGLGRFPHHLFAGAKEKRAQDRVTLGRTGIQVSFDHPASNPRFPASLEIAAFRIIQEALTNTARHAGVDHVLVELRADPEYLRLRIEDLGHGFNPDLEPAGRSAGLTGMKERALLIGGQVTIESARDAGTRIFVVLPLRGTGSTWN